VSESFAVCIDRDFDSAIGNCESARVIVLLSGNRNRRLSRCPSRRNSSSNLFSKALRLTWTTKAETQIDEPSIINKKSMICCHVLRVERLTVLRPASVIAETVRKSESMKRTLRGGVDDPQKIMPEMREVKMKYR